MVAPSTAAAQISTPGTIGFPVTGGSGGNLDWQEQLWDYYQSVPELANGIGWLVEGVSRAEMYPARYTDEGRAGDRTDDSALIAAAAPLLSPDRRPEFLQQMARFLLVPGEGWLFGYENTQALRPRDRSVWTVVDDRNVQTINDTEGSRDGFTVRYVREDAEDTATVERQDNGGLSQPLIRIWEPDPREPWEATSPIIANRQILCALKKVTDLVPALADQRITGPRILAVSNRVDAPAVDPKHKYSDDGIMNQIARAVDVAKNNPGSIENLLVLLLRGDLDEKVFEKLEWSVEFPELMVDVMNVLVQRLANSLPLPAEVTLGEATGSHWQSWFNEESAVKFAIEPIVAKIAAVLARKWLPIVLPDDYDPDEWTVGYNIRTVMLRPDRSSDAIQVYDRGQLSDEALRRETGFDEKDAPSEAERAQRPSFRDPTPGPDPGQGDTRPHRSQPRNENRDFRDPPDDALIDRGLDAAAAIAVRSALSRVGSKLRNGTHGKDRERFASFNDYEIHTRADVKTRARWLDDPEQAWPDGVLEDFTAAAAKAGYDPDCAENAIRSHVAACVGGGRMHDPDVLVSRMRSCGNAV